MRARFRLLMVLLLVGCGSDDAHVSTGVDLQVDRAPIEATLQLSDEEFAADDCAVIEGAVAEPGMRRLLRFDTIVVNRGNEDLVVGDPADPELPFAADDFEYSPCHQHYHFLGFATYELRDVHDNRVGFGHKQSFCMT
ncbi:MAG: lysyl oxidase family protein, partial [Candidatus Binatia bacterium]